ncbi:MAG: hypothetical protein JOZ08_25020 [Verrucomicrobia bacterium]|nr:hypothetical protein [Verrucomicrobiota bacterium]
MIDLTRNVLETLRSDQEFVLYRGRNIDDASQILMLSPAAVNPSPAILRRLEHEYFLREALDPAWSARPIALSNHWDRPVLVTEEHQPVERDRPVASARWAWRSAVQLLKLTGVGFGRNRIQRWCAL